MSHYIYAKSVIAEQTPETLKKSVNDLRISNISFSLLWLARKLKIFLIRLPIKIIQRNMFHMTIFFFYSASKRYIIVIINFCNIQSFNYLIFTMVYDGCLIYGCCIVSLLLERCCGNFCGCNCHGCRTVIFQNIF